MNVDLGLKNPETYVLMKNRFNNYMVVIFTDLKKAQIKKIPYRYSPYQEIKILMSFDCLHLFRSNEHCEDYLIRKPNDGNFSFTNEDKKYIHVGEKFFRFETNDEIVKYSSAHGFNDIKFPYAYDEENIYFTLHQKHILLQEYQNSTVKIEYQYLYKKDEELKSNNITIENDGIVEYGNDFYIVKLSCLILNKSMFLSI